MSEREFLKSCGMDWRGFYMLGKGEWSRLPLRRRQSLEKKFDVFVESGFVRLAPRVSTAPKETSTSTN